MPRRIFVGDVRVDAWPDQDRGQAYGDGLFETLRAHRGALPWWEAHWSRLALGAERLGLELPRQTRVREEATSLLKGKGGVLKLLLTRGAGGRGYSPAMATAPTWMLSHHDAPEAQSQGLILRWCETRLALQPVLAGIKHCNRLEQVMARRELSEPAPDENADDGLMLSAEGDVVCATAANLFVLRGRKWLTPRIDRCGIAGVCRAWAIPHLEAEEVRLGVDEVESADAVVLCNAVRGILGVARLASRIWPPHPEVAALQRELGAHHPAFAPGTEVS